MLQMPVAERRVIDRLLQRSPHVILPAQANPDSNLATFRASVLNSTATK